jgi:[CysO sulfur-carrier protein]-S-L-cysteine hydrolase
MKICQKLVDQLIEHAREELPNECCGLVAGKDGEALAVHRLRNEEESPYRYRMHGQDEYDARKAIEEAGQEVIAAYHSHTKTAAYPSQTDVNDARFFPELIFLIVSLQDLDAPDVKGFRLADLNIAEAELVVE